MRKLSVDLLGAGKAVAVELERQPAGTRGQPADRGGGRLLVMTAGRLFSVTRRRRGAHRAMTGAVARSVDELGDQHR